MTDWRLELQALVDEANAGAKNFGVGVEVTAISRPDGLEFRDARVVVKDQHDLACENQLRNNSAIEAPLPRYKDAGWQKLHVAESPEIARGPSIESQSDEINQHVARFKAHQPRLIKEREDFAARELKRMRSSASAHSGGACLPKVGWYRVK